MTASQTSFAVTRPHTAHFNDEAHAVQPDLPKGPVRIRYASHQHNDVYGHSIAVYACYRNSDPDSRIGTFFATALERFQS